MQTLPSEATIYYTLTEAQLKHLITDSVTTTLEELGLTLNFAKTKLADAKDEYKPLEYWLKELNVNRSTIWRWQQQGIIAPTKMGKKLFFCQKDFDEMFAKKSNK